MALSEEVGGWREILIRKTLLLARMTGRAGSAMVAQGMKEENVVQPELGHLYHLDFRSLS